MSGEDPKEYNGGRISVVIGDITRLDIDAIVNAANSELARGGGVCGAIFRAAGPALGDACSAVAPCPTGESRITPGFDSQARWIVHSVGPVWHGGGANEAGLLASAYRSALEVAGSNGVRSIAFPAISTGIYGFPFEKAAAIAVGVAREWVAAQELPHAVVFVFLSQVDAGFYEKLLADGSSAGP